MLVYAELPASLTEPVAAPAPPPMGCRLTSGQAVPCVLDGLLREQEWQQLLQRINDDRSTSGRLSSAAVLQKFPTEAPASQSLSLDETKVP
ncbi:hypothetical protein LRX76_11800 [Stenotrophomonas sp. MMGLT7]|nr:hypothetical protein [Stenotrophomonas sp. MMGLT7]